MNNKDLIEDIKAKLKASQELPYREGAWERFAAQQGKAGNTNVISFKRLATIAAVGLSVLAVSFYLYRSQENDFTVDTQIAERICGRHLPGAQHAAGDASSARDEHHAS